MLRQADAIAARLAALPFHALYCNDLDRAVQTASRIATKTGHDVHPEVFSESAASHIERPA